MLDLLKQIDSFDTAFFTPHENQNNVKLEFTDYKNKGEKIGGSAMGDLYDIVLFRLSEDIEVIDLDRFEAILSEPKTYIFHMIKENWYGMVAKKTTTSHIITDKVFDKWLDMSYNND
jgi:hypothetical protein